MPKSTAEKNATMYVCPLLAGLRRGEAEHGDPPKVNLQGLIAQEGPRPTLTNAERQVMALMAQGLTNASIADELFVSTNTIKTHVRSIFHKLGVNCRSLAVTYSVAAGLIDITPIVDHLRKSPVGMVREQDG